MASTAADKQPELYRNFRNCFIAATCDAGWCQNTDITSTVHWYAVNVLWSNHF